MSEDRLHMRRAIALAQAQVGRTAENPAVGCVIVNGGEVVGEGATGEGGRPHAEEIALAQAGGRARGATAYVTLEPCAQRSSGSASCSVRLAQAGVARVVIACPDTSPYAHGRGVSLMRASGALIDLGLLATEAANLYSNYRPENIAPPNR